MSKLSLGARKRPVSAEPQLRQQWRARADAPISLTARPTVDSATGQKALVLAFAAVAVAGAAYFATVMLSPNDDPASVVSRANARPQTETQTVADVTKPAEAPAAEVAAAAPEPKAVDVTTAASTKQAAVFPAPVRVKTVAVQTAAAANPEAPAVAESSPATEVAATSQTEELPVAANAYAAGDPIVSEGIEAVMGIAAKEQPDSPAVARKKNSGNDETQVASAVPEMAGGGAARKVRTAVTMRSRPANGASPVGTIPTNASITVAPGCKAWCQVTYNGKRGFIYKGFLR